jgi:2-furoyl-CoA dehydrogenase large subunit
VNVHGSRTLAAGRDAVFAAILDPTVLLAVIPGCSEIERVDATTYRARIALRLPGIVGSWRTTVRLSDIDAPNAATLHGQLDGTLGSIRGDASFRLTEDGGRTTVEYDGHATIDGPLARLDSRFVEGLAGSLIGQGLADLDRRLAAATPTPIPTAPGPAEARR